MVYQRPVSQEDHFRFLVSASVIPGTIVQFSDYIDENIKKPEPLNRLDYGYVKNKWLQMTVLVDDAETLNKAQQIRIDLQKYIDSCTDDVNAIKKANALVETIQMTMYLIQNDVEPGKKLCAQTAKIGMELGDELIQIASLYHLCDFLVAEGDLEGFIKLSEKVFEIDSKLTYPSPYKTKNIVHLIDAYIFKGGNTKRVVELLNDLYEDPKTRPHSYSLYAQFLTDLPKGHPIQKDIFQKFNVKNYAELGTKIDSLTQYSLVPNEYYHVLNFTSKMLFSKEFFNEAFSFKDKAIAVTRKTYSEDLSQSLADFQTEKAVQQKERELLLTKQKSKFYGIIAGLIAALLLISLLLLFLNTKKNRILRQKNGLINKTLLEKERLLNEKQLLFKEMHHRVKNNFQLLSSLLELQITDVKDKKALKMVEDGQSRIKSMALIHQNLYKDDDLKISINDYVKKLIVEISAVGTKHPRISVQIPNYKFDIDTALPLGLILNELITNSFKYGFTNKIPELSVTLQKLEEIPLFELLIKDNGNGLNDKEQFSNPESMGFWLVQRLVRQLAGQSSYHYNNGAVFSIKFKDTQERLKVP